MHSVFGLSRSRSLVTDFGNFLLWALPLYFFYGISCGPCPYMFLIVSSVGSALTFFCGILFGPCPYIFLWYILWVLPLHVFLWYLLQALPFKKWKVVEHNLVKKNLEALYKLFHVDKRLQHSALYQIYSILIFDISRS